MKTVTIKRSEWIRGDKAWGDAVLFLPADNNRGSLRCCLGFLGRACGYSDERMRWESLPSNLGKGQLWPDKLFDIGGWKLTAYADPQASLVEDALAAINDADIDEPTREAWIEEGFKSMGYQIVWED